jgi:hypothetical protein
MAKISKPAQNTILDNHWLFGRDFRSGRYPNIPLMKVSNTKNSSADIRAGRGSVPLLKGSGCFYHCGCLFLMIMQRSIQSVVVLPSATLYERETLELLGCQFCWYAQHGSLLLPDKWPVWSLSTTQAFTGLSKRKYPERVSEMGN